MSLIFDLKYVTHFQKTAVSFPPCACGYNLTPSQTKEFWEAAEFSEQKLLLMQDTNCNKPLNYSKKPPLFMFLFFLLQIWMFANYVW